jgi:site-specific DNA recombinase
LKDIHVKPELIPPIVFQLENTLMELNKENFVKEQLTSLNKNIDILEKEYFYFIGGEMNKETYAKFGERYASEKAKLLTQLENCQLGSSNHQESLNKVVTFCANLLSVWQKGNIIVKEKRQRLLFPEGLAYDKKIGAFRTDTTNFLITEIAGLAGDLAFNNFDLTSIIRGQSHPAETEGFEPSIRLPVYKLSRLARSTTLTGLRISSRKYTSLRFNKFKKVVL